MVTLHGKPKVAGGRFRRREADMNVCFWAERTSSNFYYCRKLQMVSVVE